MPTRSWWPLRTNPWWAASWRLEEAHNAHRAKTNEIIIYLKKMETNINDEQIELYCSLLLLGLEWHHYWLWLTFWLAFDLDTPGSPLSCLLIFFPRMWCFWRFRRISNGLFLTSWTVFPRCTLFDKFLLFFLDLPILCVGSFCLFLSKKRINENYENWVWSGTLLSLPALSFLYQGVITSRGDDSLLNWT